MSNLYLYLAESNSPHMSYLLGDIGGTNLRLCMYSNDEVTKTQVFSTTKYPKLEVAMKEF